jgi:preprotein translocase subunit SecG
MLYIAILLLHIVVCIFLIIVVLLQSGKAADLAGAFGGMGSQTAFGPRGSATLLSKATTVSAVIFMLTSLSLSILATNRAGVGTTVLQEAPRGGVPTKTQAPVPLPGSPNQAPGGSGSVTVPLPMKQIPAPAPANTPPAPKK